VDLHRLAWSAGLIARDEDMLATMERVYHAWLEEGEQLEAARAAFWLGFRLMVRGDSSAGSGWLSRAQRLAELHAGDCVERGYLLLPAAQRLLSAGESIKAHDCALQAAEIGARFAEADLIAFARNLQARAMFSDGQIPRALTLMDEAMVAATPGELSPVVTGLVYCTAIASCRGVFALDRVREWTAALASWCEAHPQLGMFTGHCLVRRAEVLELSGSWPESVAEARRAVERCVRNVEREAAGRAHYQQAEIHRLRGEFAVAEASPRDRCARWPAAARRRSSGGRRQCHLVHRFPSGIRLDRSAGFRRGRRAAAPQRSGRWSAGTVPRRSALPPRTVVGNGPCVGRDAARIVEAIKVRASRQPKQQRVWSAA